MVDPRYVPPEIPGYTWLSNHSMRGGAEEIRALFASKYQIPAESVHVFFDLVPDGMSSVYVDSEYGYKAVELQNVLDILMKVLKQQDEEDDTWHS